MRILSTNYIQDESTVLTPTSEVSGYPVENVAIPNLKRIFKFTGNSGSITIDFGSSKTINAICFGNINITNSGTITINGNTSDSWGAPAYSESFSISTNEEKNKCNFLGGSYQYWKIDFSDLSLANIEIGHIFIGQYFQCPGWTMAEKTYNNTAVSNISRTRMLYGNKGINYKTWSINFATMQDDEFNSFIDMLEENQGVEPIYLILYEGSLDIFPPYFARMEAGRISASEEFIANSNNISLNFEEVK